MAQTTPTSVKHRRQMSQEQLMKRLEVSNFDPNAILRGFQLTIVGALRALQNPALFTSEHYKQAALAVAAGILIRLAVAVPIMGIKVLLWFLAFFVDFSRQSWDDKLVNGLDFTQNYVLQLPIFLMTLMRYVVPTLDTLFMESLKWVDTTYYAKHQGQNPAQLRKTYYDNLRQYPISDGSTNSRSTVEALTMFLVRYGKKAGISLIVFALSYVPILGRFVLPAASFYTFNRVAGLGPAAIVFGTGVFLPKRYLVIFLQSYFSSRSLMRELLEPYFSRIRFSKEQKRHWFHDREGLLFGFGVGFYMFVRIPLLGVLVYGIAEASTAYLITKITDPPPGPAEVGGFAASQQEWKNKHEFLDLSLAKLDAHHHDEITSTQDKSSTEHRDSAPDGELPPPYEEAKQR